MRTPVALFPFCAEFLPIVRHFEEMQDRYSIVKLVSPPGLGLGGKDAAYACNHPSIELTVTDVFDAEDTSWEVLLVSRTAQSGIVDNDTLSDITRTAINAGKSVSFYDNRAHDVPSVVSDLSSTYPDKVTIHTADSLPIASRKTNDEFTPLNTPVILVGGLVAGEDMLEVITALCVSLKEKGLFTTVFTKCCGGMMIGYKSINSIIDNNENSEAEKINELNRLLNTVQHIEMPNVILIEAPDAFMRFNDIAPNGYGVQTYMLCQAASPDYIICCVPCDLADRRFLSIISKDMSFRLGSVLNSVHISNVIVDSADVLQTHKISYVHVSMGEVDKRINDEMVNSEIPMFDVISNGAEALCSVLFGRS